MDSKAAGHGRVFRLLHGRTADWRTVAGICHARGDNTNLPAQRLIYITVADLEASLQRCITLGGKVVCPAREMGDHGTMAVIQDPAGAVAALFQPKQI